ncbi:MAG: bifunctional YncE family protein/alkaline phosphatase family protein, partial [Gemmatimonadaceae bacterium]
SIVLAPRRARQSGRRYPAGLALSPDGRMLYAAENLDDSLAVIDLASQRVVQRLATEAYPYGVVTAPNGTVYVSAWGGHTVSIFTPAPNGRLRDAGRVSVARHPSALLLNADGSRLFVASGSTDRVDVLDTRTRSMVSELRDAPPAGPGEGSTPNALALAANGRRLLVAEADNNAIAIFDLSTRTAGTASGVTRDTLAGRIPTDWYPTDVLVRHDTLIVLSGKGRGTAPNPDGPDPAHASGRARPRSYTLGQTSGTLMSVALAAAPSEQLAPLSARVATGNGWGARDSTGEHYPPFQHVIYVIKENRTYDQVLGDLSQADGDTALLFFPRAVGPNHHALAERFGIFDRFFVDAEVSADGHNWSTAAYATDYLEKTVPSEYSGRGRTYDYEGTNRGRESAADLPDDDVAEPANGYLWDLAARANITFRNYGEFVVRDSAGGDRGQRYVGDKPFLRDHTNPHYAGFDLNITDQSRMDVWLNEFNTDVETGRMPALEVIRLPNDHTAGMRAGAPTPRAYFADNDLALGRMIGALSRSPFWKSTVVFVLEDDAQNGPDHVDSHRSVLLVISPYNHGGVIHRFVNTTDVIATMVEILHLGALSQFDFYGRPLRDIFAGTPDLAAYDPLPPA